MNMDDTGVALRVCVAEVRRKAAALMAAGGLIVVAALVVGTFSPANYQSSVSILAERQNIIEPLLAGRAVRTEVMDMAQNAREGIYNRSLMTAALQRANRLPADASGVEVENALMGMRARTSVNTVGSNLIRISYEDRTAEDAYEMTRILGELFMEDLLQTKQRESEAAYEFIDTQARKYQSELNRSRAQIQALREADPSLRPGVFDELSRRQVTLAAQIDDLEQRLREGRIREASLQEQLTGEVEIANLTTRTQQLGQRIAELRDELDRLRLSYHDSYPDIVHIRQQIADLERQVEAEEEGAEGASGRVRLDSTVRANPVYQQLQRELYDVRTEMHTLEDRLVIARQRHEDTGEELLRLHDAQIEIEQLQRDAQVNQDIYDDLVRRRENARVSRNLDAEQQGLKVRVQESAYLPQTPSGPTRIHYAAAGLVLGMSLPVAVLVGWLVVDPRVRHGSHLPPLAHKALLGSVPVLPRRRSLWRQLLHVLLILAVLAALAAGAWYVDLPALASTLSGVIPL